ncbi:MAG: DUF983 domain-containing protein [Cyclobacteriaceae bacterium]
MSEKKLFQAIIQCKCPQCREGNMFTNKPYDLKRFGKMPENCPKCDFRFEREPGFFYGAMYVSYALSVGIFLTTVFVLYFLLDDPSIETYVISVGVMAIVLYPLTFRYSRVIFVNLFSGVKYDPTKTKAKDVS